MLPAGQAHSGPGHPLLLRLDRVAIGVIGRGLFVIAGQGPARRWPSQVSLSVLAPCAGTMPPTMRSTPHGPAGSGCGICGFVCGIYRLAPSSPSGPGLLPHVTAHRNAHRFPPSRVPATVLLDGWGAGRLRSAAPAARSVCRRLCTDRPLRRGNNKARAHSPYRAERRLFARHGPGLWARRVTAYEVRTSEPRIGIRSGAGRQESRRGQLAEGPRHSWRGGSRSARTPILGR